jgi:nucleoside triphosphate pyrophosphatase
VKIFLASLSPRRKEILKRLGIKFTVLVPKVSETFSRQIRTTKGSYEVQSAKTKVAVGFSLRNNITRNLKVATTTYLSGGLQPKEYAKTLAKLKVESVSRKVKDGLIIGMDTIVVLGKKIMGKPKNRAEAKRMISILSDKTHTVITGIYLLRLPDGKSVQGFEMTRVKFRKLSGKEIECYIKMKEPYDKAGAYGVQGQAGLFVESINGCYFNVVGFPVAKFLKLFKGLTSLSKNPLKR